jgi:tRNA nucleotidyltransferase (CCA-adding enzyme)
MLNKDPKDLDFSSKLTPEQVIELLDRHGIRHIPTGIRRGTITALIDGEPAEITTFRNPSNENQFTETIEEDLPARDFTINAMAVNVHSLTLIDPFGGANDLANGIIKCVREPEKRFTEDPHRILRMVRFGPAQGRNVDPRTLESALKHKNKLVSVSTERISDEFVKILCSDGVTQALKFMEGSNILDLIIPELREGVGFEQNKYHVFDVFEHIVDVVGSTPNDKVIRFAALLHDIGKPRAFEITDKGRQFIGHEQTSAEMAGVILTRLKRPNDEKKKVITLVEQHMRNINGGPKSVRKTMFALGDLFDSWLALKKADLFSRRSPTLTWDVHAEWEAFMEAVAKERAREEIHSMSNLAIGGKDLLELGFKQGPEIGKVLRRLQELVLEEPSANNKETLLACAKAYRRTET